MEMHPTDLHNRVLIYLLDCLRCHLIQACLELENAAGEDRTHDLRIMRPTRYQLRYCRLHPVEETWGIQGFAMALQSHRARARN